MALREKTHASWGTLGVRTKKSEKIRGYPKSSRKRKQKKKPPYEVKPLTTKELIGIKNTYRSRDRGKEWERFKLRQKMEKQKNNKTVTVRVVSRAHVPAERVNRKKN